MNLAPPRSARPFASQAPLGPDSSAKLALRLRQWAKGRRSWPADLAYRAVIWGRHLAVPMVGPIHRPLYHAWLAGRGLARAALRIFWWTPLFNARLATPAPQLHLDNGMPLVMGPLTLQFGRGCRVSGQTTLVGRSAGEVVPELLVGDNVDIGWQTTIAVGRRVVLGDNVRIAGRAFLAGFPGHPLEPASRAAGLPDTDDQIGDIVLEDDVWLATGVTVLAGVCIGRGTVVAAGSVVTRDLPPGVLAAGVPAKPLRPILSAGSLGRR